MHPMNRRLRPTTPATQPLTGRMIAFETRYEVSTQVLSSLLTPRLPAMYGSATLAMLVSRISMNAARATTVAINHGLDGMAQRLRAISVAFIEERLWV